MKSKKRVLVTGSSGFIGQRLVQALLLQGHRVMGIDVKKTQQPSQGSFRFTKGAIDAEKLKKTGFVPDWIFHCAGGASVGFAESHAREDFQMNVVSALELLQFARLTGGRPKVVLLSSAAIYGNAGKKKLGEKQPPRPVSNYGFHKYVTEILLRFYAKKWSVPCVVVRIFSVYGEGLRKQVFWDAAQKMWRGNHEFFGNGRETRDFVHVDDVCRFLIKIITRAREGVPVYNCGRGKPVSMTSALRLLAKHLKRPAPLFNGKLRPGDPRHLVADPSMVAGLGWSPRIDFPEGVRRYAEWFQNLQKSGRLGHEKK
jgi:UDP-glucose 4-epimerase